MTVTSQSNPSCGTASDTVDVTVYPEPAAAAGPDQKKCEDDGKSFAMAATASNGSILWTVDSVSPSDLVVSFSDATAEDPTVTLSKVGTATLKMTVTSQSNPSCGTASSLVAVTVYPEPAAAAGPDQKKCEDDGKSFLMAATASNGTILWTVDSKSPSDLVVSFSDATAEDPTVTLSKVGTATLKMTVTSQSNPSCGTASSLVAVTVYPEPAAAAGPDQKKCEDDGKSFLMAATASNGTILWTVDSKSPSDLVVSFSDATAEDPTVTLSKVGTATLKMTVTSQSNPSCGTASSLVAVTVYPEPAAAAGPDQKKCEDDGKSFAMAATASNGTILWTVDSKSPSDLVVSFSDATAEDPTVTLSKVGTATLKMTVTSQSNPSCGTASDTIAVTVNDISVAPLGSPVTCNAAHGGGIAVFTATPTSTSAAKDFGWQIGIETSPGSGTFDAYTEASVVTGLTFTENPNTGVLTTTINTSTYKGGLAAGQYQVRAVATDPITTCVSAAATGILTVTGPAIACGADCAGGAAPLLVHRLDGDAQGGAAIVNNAAVALDTFPSGTDISYESFDRFAALGIAPGQVTTTQIEVPICNKGNVPLESVHLTFYKGDATLEQNPTDCTLPDGTVFGGTLDVGQSVTLLCTIQVQCGTVPITVTGTSSAANGACTVASSCSVEVDCIEVFCRTTGGGRQDPGPTTLLQVKSGNSLVTDTSVKFTTHGGQMRGRQTIPLSAADIQAFINGNPNICGQWQHVRHASSGRLQS